MAGLVHPGVRRYLPRQQLEQGWFDDMRSGTANGVHVPAGACWQSTVDKINFKSDWIAGKRSELMDGALPTNWPARPARC